MKNYWDVMASNEGFLATSHSQDINELEIYVISKWLTRDADVLDLGCGTGLKTNEWAKNCKSIVGIDSSKEMIDKCRQTLSSDFFEGDMRKLDFKDESFDIVITDRALINILSEKEQKMVIDEIYRVLRPFGIYLCLENFRDLKDDQNILRECFGLKARQDNEHNLFISKNVEDYMREKFAMTIVQDFGGLHDLALYFFTILSEGKEPQYDNPIIKKTVEATIEYHKRMGKYPNIGFGQNRLMILFKDKDLCVTANN